ncbi:MAG: phosphoribosylanthranilate isomerase [Thioalkalispiraceae bacterium]
MYQRTRVKICGITRREDGVNAAQLGADAIGLVFYAQSPRYVSRTMARTIVEALPPFVTTVGLFIDATAEEVHETLKVVRLDLLQFHGDESPAYCEQFGMPYLKALRMRDNVNVSAFAQEHFNAAGILLDTYQQGLAGGTGKTFDWSTVPDDVPLPLVLAGGLNAQNVAQAIDTVHPYAVDVSGGVETQKGIKDPEKMSAFLKEVYRVG